MLQLSNECLDCFLDLLEVVLAIWQAKPLNFSSSHTDLALTFLELKQGIVGFSFCVSVKDENELLLLQGLAGEDWHLLEKSLVGK